MVTLLHGVVDSLFPVVSDPGTQIVYRFFNPVFEVRSKR
jgi:16S rRNA C1402 (ribose-2'-O) methylase RsmI